jgi:diguanylate cyclase (GGDEF)-like protein
VPTLRKALQKVESNLLKDALARYKTQALAAKHLGITQSTVARKAKRYGHKVSVVVFDVDDRKAGKERTGSAVGDQVLSDMGRLLKRSARGTDCVARYSGDEFRILLPHTDASEAKLAADRLRGVVEGHAFSRRKKLTLTVGVATYPTEAVDSAAQAKRAEPVLAEAKVEPPVSLNGNGNGHKAAVN